MQRASLDAQRYGMPPLKDCPKEQGGSRKSPVPARLAGSWRLGHAAPFAVQYAPAAVLGGRIWMAGGLTGPNFGTVKTEFYDPTLDTWTPGPPLPLALHHAMMVTYRNTLWVIGGFVAQGGNVLAAASSRVLMLNKTQNGWIEGPPLHHARGCRSGGGGGEQDSSSAGGPAHPSKLVTPTEIFDGTRWHDAAAIPVPGNHLAAASDGTYLYAVGGHKMTETSNTTAVQRFDPATGQWTQLPPMPTAASGLGAAIIAGELITVGGDNANHRVQHRPGIQPGHQDLGHPAKPPRSPNRDGRHGLPQHPLRRRWSSPTRAHRIHQHRTAPHPAPCACSACWELAAGACCAVRGSVCACCGVGRPDLDGRWSDWPE